MQIVVNLVIFVVAAVFGLMLITDLMRDAKPPRRIIVLHGGAAIIGLALLTISYVRLTSPLLLVSLLAFLAAALGGITIFFMDYKDIKIPKWLPMMHATAAISAIIILIVALIDFF